MTGIRLGTVALMAALALAAVALPALALDVVKPPTNARIDDNYSTSGYRVVLKLKGINVVVGTVALVKCKGGKKKGCPEPVRGKTKRIKAKHKGSLSLRAALKGNKLAVGAVVTITLRDPGALFYKRTFTVGKSFSVASQGYCEQPTGAPVGCA